MGLIKYLLEVQNKADLNDPLSLSLCLSPLYSLTALVDLGRFCSFLIHTQWVGLLGRVISPSQGRYLQAGQHKH
jgi:hypothetical protein